MAEYTIDKHGVPGSLSHLPKSKFFANFEKLCKDHGYSIRSCAAKLGIANSSTTRWRKGEMPNVANLNKICEFFNVTVDELLGTDEQPRMMMMDTEDQRIIRAFRKMSDADKNVLMALIAKYED